jgi:hypothetical protein
MNTYWGVELQLHAFVTSVLDGGEWSASRPGERAPGTHCVGLEAGLDTAVAKRGIPSSSQESNPDRPARSLVAILTELFRLQGLTEKTKNTVKKRIRN